MKAFFTIFFLTISIYLNCQNLKGINNAQENKSLYKSLQNVLKKDSLSYEHYLISKRCFCRENYLTMGESRSGLKYHRKTNTLYKLHNNLKEVGYLFFIAMDKKKMVSFFEKTFLNERIYNRDKLSKDHLLIDNKDIICEAVSAYSKGNYNQFIQFINNKNNYNKKLDYKGVWKNDKTFFKEIMANYPYLKDEWYILYRDEEVLETN